MKMETQRKSIIAALVLIGAIASASAQLTYHLDANTNSFTLQTPNSQQTFTRYFGQANNVNGNAAGPIQTAQSQQQQSYRENNLQSQADLYLRQQQIQQQQQQQQDQEQQVLLQQQQHQALQQEQQQALLQQQQQQQQQQQPQQQQSPSSQDLELYYQQLQQAQQAQQAQQQQQLQLQQQQLQPQQYAQQQDNRGVKHQQSNLLGVNYSPSNEVSHVKYTSDSLNYNF